MKKIVNGQAAAILIVLGIALVIVTSHAFDLGIVPWSTPAQEEDAFDYRLDPPSYEFCGQSLCP